MSVGRDVGDALDVDVVGHDPAAVGDRGDDRRLGRRVVPPDVGAGVGFGVAERLGFGQGRFVVGAVLGHLGEDVVGGAVDDAHHPGDVLAGQGLAQGTDEGDAPGDRGLEEKVDAVGVGDGEQLRALGRQQGLVGGDHRLAVGEGLGHQVVGGVDAAHELDDDVDGRVVDHRVRVVGEVRRGEVDGPGLGQVTDRDRADLERDPGPLGDLLAATVDQADERAAHHAASQQPDPDPRRCHGRSR